MILKYNVRRCYLIALLSVMFSLESGLLAKEGTPDRRGIRSPYLVNLIACEALKSATEKISCYENNVSALDKAEADGEIILLDRTVTKEARRGMFGLSLPVLSRIFGDEKGKAARGGERIDRLEAKIQRAYETDGRWVLVLEDGAKWVQTDSEPVAIAPKAGQGIVIRKAAMGSYFANVNGQRAIRVHREN